MRRGDYQMRRKRSDMRQADEDRTDQDEDGDGFGDERNPIRPVESQKKDEDPKHDRTVNENAVDIENRDIAEDDVGNRIAHREVRVHSGVRIDDQAYGQQEKTG